MKRIMSLHEISPDKYYVFGWKGSIPFKFVCSEEIGWKRGPVNIERIRSHLYLTIEHVDGTTSDIQVHSRKDELILYDKVFEVDNDLKSGMMIAKLEEIAKQEKILQHLKDELHKICEI